MKLFSIHVHFIFIIDYFNYVERKIKILSLLTIFCLYFTLHLNTKMQLCNVVLHTVLYIYSQDLPKSCSFSSHTFFLVDIILSYGGMNQLCWLDSNSVYNCDCSGCSNPQILRLGESGDQTFRSL
jgi:hypothetical protein